ncbi:PAS domain-containing protein [Ferrovibrio terrae]|uniref:PAS domain-containing protein n=1 Tax=Ferrovibrio terrae TaxID=2594003 RepID=UPI00313806A6
MAGQIEATVETVQRPRLRRLLEYWQARRGDRAIPGRQDIDPLDLSWLLGNISLVDVVHGADGPRYRFRLVGTRAVQRFGYDPTGRWLDDLPEPSYRQHIFKAYAEVLQRCLPLVERLDMLIDERTHDYEILRLPLSSDGATIDMILLAADFFNPDI